MSAIGRDYVLEEFGSRLTQDGAPYESVTLRDALDPGRSQNAARLHRAVHVDAPSSANTGDYRDQNLARSVDTIVVTLRYRINVTAQREHQRDAITHAEKVRVWLTDPLWIGALHVLWRGTTRASDSAATEIYTITQTYTVHRDAALGG